MSTPNRNNRRYINRTKIVQAGLAAELERLLPNAPLIIVLLETVDGDVSPEWQALIDETKRRLLLTLEP